MLHLFYESLDGQTDEQALIERRRHSVMDVQRERNYDEITGR